MSFCKPEESNPKSPDVYAKNLSMLYILIEKVGFFKKACEDEYHEYSDTNQISFDTWEAEHKEFHDEIQGLVDDIIFQQVSSGGGELMELRKEFKDQMTAGQNQVLELLKKSVKEDGGDFKEWCSNYPNYIQSDLTDIQTKYKEKVSAMHAAKELLDAEKTPPRTVISITKNNEIGKMKAGDLIMLLEAKIPFPKENDTIEKIVELLNLTGHKIIEQTPTLLQVQGNKQSSETGEMNPAFLVEYQFKNRVYVKGPIIKENTIRAKGK